MSDDIVTSTIADIANNILSQLIAQIQENPCRLSLQFDETTDVKSISQLMAYVRFVKRNAIADVFVLQEVRNRTKNIFDFVKHFFVKIHYRRVKWDGFAQTVRPLLQGTKPVL